MLRWNSLRSRAAVVVAQERRAELRQAALRARTCCARSKSPLKRKPQLVMLGFCGGRKRRRKKHEACFANSEASRRRKRPTMLCCSQNKELLPTKQQRKHFSLFACFRCTCRSDWTLRRQFAQLFAANAKLQTQKVANKERKKDKKVPLCCCLFLCSSILRFVVVFVYCRIESPKSGRLFSFGVCCFRLFLCSILATFWLQFGYILTQLEACEQIAKDARTAN